MSHLSFFSRFPYETIYNITNRRIRSPVDAHSDELYDTVYEDVVYNEPMNIDTHAIDEVPDINEVQFKTDDVDIGPVVYDDTLIGYDTPEVESTYVVDEVVTPVEPTDVIDDTYAHDDVLTDELPEIEQPVLRRSARNHQPGRWAPQRRNRNVNCCINDKIQSYYNSYAFNMTVKDGITKLGDIAVDSIRKEMQQMCEKDVWEGVLINSLSPLQRNNIITSSMFLKDKYTAEGKFDKLKSRLVAGGHLQDRDIYDNGSSPTVSTTSVFIIAAIAA